MSIKARGFSSMSFIVSAEFEHAAIGSPGRDSCRDRREEVTQSLPRSKPATGPRWSTAIPPTSLHLSYRPSYRVCAPRGYIIPGLLSAAHLSVHFSPRQRLAMPID